MQIQIQRDRLGHVAAAIDVDEIRWSEPGVGSIDARRSEREAEIVVAVGARGTLSRARASLGRHHATIAAATVDLASGETRDLTLRLEPGASSELRNESDAPVHTNFRANNGLIESVDLQARSRIIKELPSGSFELRVSDASGKEVSRRTQNLSAGERTTFVHPGIP